MKASDNERIIYELVPNIDVFFYGGRVITSHEGFRDRNYTLEKSPNTIRIIGLGDSCMFGQGVNNNQNYLAFLEDSLNTNHSAKRWEVINTAVNGYNTIMEVETLRTKGLKYKPDIVIIDFIGNDLNLPNFMRVKRDYFSFRDSFLLGFIKNRLNNIAPNKMPIVDTPDALLYPDDFDEYLKTIPPHLKYMVGWDAVRSALSELKQLGIKENFEVYILIGHYSGNHYAKALEIAQGIGINVIDYDATLKEYLSKNGPRSLDVSQADGHPSAIAHRLMAESILHALSNKSNFFK